MANAETPPLDYYDENKDSIARVQLKSTVKTRRSSATMRSNTSTNERRLVRNDVDSAEQFPSTPSLRSDMASKLESHQGGCLGPTKQVPALEDREDQIGYYNFATTKEDIAWIKKRYLMVLEA
ncbi:MAG: hypothetical protein L6R39_004158 [Caloplaca ligustica]|nr:MAG: hypothetical protein L6R39_004158 [Caloplaca ligustica]